MAFETIAQSAEIPEGGRIVVEMGEHWLAVFRISGKLYAIEDLCTHDDGPLAEGTLDGTDLECPRHGAIFDLKTGKPTFPAVKAVPRYAIQEQDNAIQVDIETIL